MPIHSYKCCLRSTKATSSDLVRSFVFSPSQSPSGLSASTFASLSLATSHQLRVSSRLLWQNLQRNLSLPAFLEAMARSSGLTKPAPRSRPSRQSALANGLKSYRAASASPLPDESSIPVPANPDEPSTAGAGPNDSGAFGTATGKRRDNNFLEKLWG